MESSTRDFFFRLEARRLASCLVYSSMNTLSPRTRAQVDNPVELGALSTLDKYLDWELIMTTFYIVLANWLVVDDEVNRIQH